MGPLCLQQCLLLSTCVLQGALWRRLFLLEKSRAALVPCWSRCPKLFLAPQGKLEQWQGEGRDLLLGSSLSLNWTLPPNCHPTETETLLQIDTKLRPPNCHPTVSPSSELSPNWILLQSVTQLLAPPSWASNLTVYRFPTCGLFSKAFCNTSITTSPKADLLKSYSSLNWAKTKIQKMLKV